MERKAQLTVIVIVGIVLVIVFGIVFWLRGELVQQGGGDDSHVQEFKRSVDVYVTGCLELLGADAIKKAGEQGGDLYDVVCEDGTCTDPDKVHWEERNSTDAPKGDVGVDFLPHICDARTCYVSYGIMRNRAPPTTYAYDNWQYPYPEYDFSKEKSLKYYGDNSLRKLCDWAGPNTRDVKRKVVLSCNPGVYDQVYPPYLENFSIQEQLAFYVEKHVGECAVLTPFIKQGYDFDVGEPDVTVVFGESDVTFSLEYPLAAVRGSSARINTSKTRSVLFSKTLPFRLKRVVEYVHNLIEEDITDLDFNLTVDNNHVADANNMYRQVVGYDPSLTFKKVKNACSGCEQAVHTEDFVSGSTIQLCPQPRGCKVAYDDIIEIRDTSSMIDGKPFVFNFAVQNRRPVLDKVTSVQDGTTAQIGGTVQPKWCKDTFKLHIRAKDPDDEDDLKVQVISPSGTLIQDNYLRYTCQGILNYQDCWEELFNTHTWDVSRAPEGFTHFVSLAGAHPVLTYEGSVPTVISYNPFTNPDIILTAPIDARNLMFSSKSVKVSVEDESGLSGFSDFQDFNYKCCELATGQLRGTCYDYLLVDYTSP